MRLPLERLRRPLTVVATADEESSMCGARSLQQSRLHLGRHAVIGEPTSLRPVRMHKGIAMESIRLTGRSGHSSDPSLGASALEGMYLAMGAFLAFAMWLGKSRRDLLGVPMLVVAVLLAGELRRGVDAGPRLADLHHRYGAERLRQGVRKERQIVARTAEPTAAAHFGQSSIDDAHAAAPPTAPAVVDP